MSEQEGRIEVLAREAAAKYIAPFHKTDARLHKHRMGAVVVFEKLRKRQERELAKVIADTIRTALVQAEKEFAELLSTATDVQNLAHKGQQRDLRAQLATVREALEGIRDQPTITPHGDTHPDAEHLVGMYQACIMAQARDALAKMGDKT